jgi:hypothetical protein
MAKRIYYDNKEDIEDIYEFKKDETLSDIAQFDKDLLPETEALEIRTREGIAMPRMEDQAIEVLKRKEPNVIGNIFDKVKFLGDRISELYQMLQGREIIHKGMVEEINEDIKEKDEMSAKTVDMTDRRNLKLDMSILRKEKRHENIQFWKDVVELRSELREVLEQYQTEKKITDLFREGD